MNETNEPIVKLTKKEMNRLLSSKDTIRKEGKRHAPKLEPYKRSRFNVNDHLEDD